MANNQLIQGAKRIGDSKSFLDIGAAVGEGFKGYSDNSQNTASKKQKQIDENQNITNKVNTFMSKMKSDIDFTGFSQAETASMRNFLVAERSRYAEAANAISKLEDASSPEYMQYVDIMQSVNNSFTNLAEQIKSYKTSKVDYAESQLSGYLSNGNNPKENYQAAHMFGFYDANKDGKSDDRYDAPLMIKEGGNIAFNIGGEEIDFNGTKPLILKDRKAAGSIFKINSDIYKGGKSLSPQDIMLYGNQIGEILEDQNALASIIMDFNDELPMGDIDWDPSAENFDVNSVRAEVKKRIIEAFKSSANSGKAEKERKAQALHDKNNPKDGVAYFDTDKNGDVFLWQKMKDSTVVRKRKATLAEQNAYDASLGTKVASSLSPSSDPPRKHSTKEDQPDTKDEVNNEVMEKAKYRAGKGATNAKIYEIYKNLMKIKQG